MVSLQFWTDLVNNLSAICVNLDLFIQIPIPKNKSSQSFLTKMKCEASSNTIHNILISNEISHKSYKEICGGEKKKITLGFNNIDILKVENNTLMPFPKQSFIFGKEPAMSYVWEVLSKFFSIHNLEPNWQDCGYSWGWFDKNQGGWTGCMGKV